MSDWSAGYVADIGYTHGYYSELNPLRAQLALAKAGCAAPAITHACELGFGQGLSIATHAAASTVRWYGTDFNPAHAAQAQELTRAAGVDAVLADQSFSQFCARSDLPDFDYIGLHGIWSWVSDENRALLVDFIERKLKPGGVLYIGYNTLPGWSGFAPVRHLMAEHAKRLAAPAQGSAARIDAALAFMQNLAPLMPSFMLAAPGTELRLQQLGQLDKAYLAHEYFNRDWSPMYFSTLADHLAQAKLDYAGPADFMDNVDNVALSPEQSALLRAMPDLVLRETSRDFMLYRQFRRDYWVKGRRALPRPAAQEHLRALRVVLLTPVASVPLQFTGGRGEVNLSPAIYRPVLAALADHVPCSVHELEQRVAPHQLSLGQLVEALMVLLSNGNVLLAQTQAQIAEVAPRCRRLNAYLIEKSRFSRDINFLACPVSGGALAVPRVTQLFLLALGEVGGQAEAMAERVWQILSSQGHAVSRQGLTLEGAEDNLAELRKQAKELLQHGLPVLRALHVVDA